MEKMMIYSAILTLSGLVVANISFTMYSVIIGVLSW